MGMNEELFEAIRGTERKMHMYHDRKVRDDMECEKGMHGCGPHHMERHGRHHMPEDFPPPPPFEEDSCHSPMHDRPCPPPPFPPRNRRLPRERILSIVLDAGNDGLRQKEIGQKLHIAPSSLSEVIDKLEGDGYIERKVDPSDRRATRICLTEKGTARAYEISDEREEMLEAFFSPLSDDEKKTLLEILVKLRDTNE